MEATFQCARCHTGFCSVECQRELWPIHRRECKDMAHSVDIGTVIVSQGLAFLTPEQVQACLRLHTSSTIVLRKLTFITIMGRFVRVRTNDEPSGRQTVICLSSED